MNTSAHPPFLLDSARVLMYADTGGSKAYTGRITVHVGGKSLGPVPRLAICEELVEGRILLMHCDASWNVLAAGFAASTEAARDTAEGGYAGISSKWNQCRDLNAAELAEVHELRRSLREAAAQLPTDEQGSNAA